MALDFYHGQGSVYSWRVWLALEHKAVPYNLKVLSFADKDTTKPEFVALNPRHTVPTIVDDGYSLWESLAILEYLDERFTSGAKLYPGDAKARARVRRLIREMDGYLDAKGIDPIAEELFFKEEPARDMKRVEEGRKRLAEEFAYFTGELQGKYLAGDAPCAADFVLYPLVAFCTRIGVRKPEAKMDELLPAPLVEYRKRVAALPYADKTFPPHWR